MSQLVFKFPFKTKYLHHDFYVSKNNFSAYKLIEINRKFKINDVVQINSEQLLVIDYDDVNNKYRLRRGHNSTSIASHSSELYDSFSGISITFIFVILKFVLIHVISFPAMFARYLILIFNFMF